MLRHWSVAAFGAWNALMWLGRIRNIVEDGALDAGARALWLLPAVGFGVGGVVALVAWVTRRASLVGPLRSIGALTAAYWPLRMALILRGDHPASFRVVHAVLAVVSVGLAVAMIGRIGWFRATKLSRGGAGR